jgi:phage tail-like protein
MTVSGPGAGAQPVGAGGAGGSGPSEEVSSLSGSILDQAYNPLVQPATASMLGFQESADPEEILALRMYLFLTESIRREDLNEGNSFLEQFLQGPQDVWETIHDKIFDVKDLWSITDIPDEYLQYKKLIVGWTKDLDSITNSLDYDVLRRLIANSVSLWKARGTEDSFENILTLILGTRLVSYNYFDFRFLTGETGYGHEMDGDDPWLISEDNDREVNIRIMDDGTLDKDLVVNILKLMRPIGERFEVVYLYLLDKFSVDDDESQWGALNEADETDIFTVEDGEGVLDDTTQQEEIYSTVTDSDLWEEFVFSAKIKGDNKFGITFYRQDESNFYWFRLNTSGVANNFELIKRVEDVDTTISTISAPVGFIVDSLLYYVFRVQVAKESSTTRFTCFVDGVEVINVTDSAFSAGTVGIMHDTDGVVTVDQVEVLDSSASIDFIDINS